MRNAPMAVLSFVLCNSALAAPLLTVGRVEEPPSVDGKLDDAAWLHAIVMSDFVRIDTLKRETQPTEAFMVYDDQALYIGARCHEIVLDPRQQRGHEFRAAHGPETRDKRIWQDDSVEFFISPTPSGEPYFQFIVNARGARFDGRAKDAGWDGEWQAAGATSSEGRFFAVEMRLPFATLGPQAGSGRAWRFQIGRNRMPGDRYHCAWPPAVGGFHRVANFARLSFTDETLPRVGLAGFVDYPGVGDAKIEATGIEGAVARVHMAEPGKEELAQLEGRLDNTGRNFGPLRSALAGKIRDAGAYEVHVSLPKPGSATPLLVTPATRWLLGTYVARLSVAAKGKVEWQAAVNGRDPGGAVDSLKLQPGPNVIALRCRREAGATLRTQVSVEGRRLTDHGWKAGVPVAQWADPALDDSRWPLATSTGGWLWHGDGNEVILRRRVIIPTDGYCVPGRDPTHLARGAAQMLTFAFDGSASREGLWFELTLPRSIRLLDPVDPERLPGLSALHHERVELPDERVRHRLDLSSAGRNVDSFGGELQWCEGADGAAGMFYHRLLRFGGSSDWRRVEVHVTAPAEARSVRVWFLKWPRQGLSGLIELDDLSLKKVGSKKELIDHGDMEAAFEGTWALGAARRRTDRDGNHTIEMNAKPEAWQRQIAVRKERPVPIEGGCEYVYSCRARWRDVVQTPSAKGVYPLVVQPDEDAPAGPTAISYGWSCSSGAVTTLDYTQTCVIGPAIRGKQPEEIVLMNWPSWGYGSPLGRLATTEQLQAMSDQWLRCGMNVTTAVPMKPYFSLSLADRFRMMASIRWHNSGHQEPGAVLSFLQKHPEAQAVHYSGKATPTRACPTHLFEPEGKQLLELALLQVRREAGRYKANIYNTDYEVGVSDPPSICFDKRCIAGFRKFAGISADVELTPKTLIARHVDEWTDFQVRKNVEILKHIRDTVKSVRPAAKYMVYSGYHSDYTKRHYGVDWALMRPAMDIGSAGYGRKLQWVQDTVDALHPVPLVGGVIEYFRGTHPHTLRTRVMRRVLDCRGGVMSWYGPEVDARWQRAFADASLVAAEFGLLIRRGTRDDSLARVSGGFSQPDVCVYDDATRRLVVVFNEKDKAREGAVQLMGLGPAARVTALPSGERVQGPRFNLSVPARSYRVFGVRK